MSVGCGTWVVTVPLTPPPESLAGAIVVGRVPAFLLRLIAACIGFGPALELRLVPQTAVLSTNSAARAARIWCDQIVSSSAGAALY